MTFSAQQIATLLGGTLIGDGSLHINNVSGLEDAKKGDLCFLTEEKYLSYLPQTQASAVLMTRSLHTDSIVCSDSCCLILVDNARGAMAELLRLVAKAMNPSRKGIEQPAYISDGVEIPEDAYIGAFTYIGKGVKLGKGVQIYPHCYIGDNVHIGDHTILYPSVKLYYNCQVGSHCILHAGVVVGADGFGFEPDAEGILQKVPQIGIVVIEDDIEIGANTCIDRAMLGETRICRNTKIDNLVQIAHNVQVGQSDVLCSQVGIAGSAKIGNHCTLAGQVGVNGHIQITDNCTFGAQSGVPNSVRKPGIYMGSPILDAGIWRRAVVRFKQSGER